MYHGSEIVYFFGNLYPDTQSWTDQDRAIADALSSYLANYIATGDPNGPGLPRWPAYSPGSPTVMEVGEHYGPMRVAPPPRSSASGSGTSRHRMPGRCGTVSPRRRGSPPPLGELR
ncbi:carboxylesterase family protein [Streptomyces lutosisoli]|uniref:Carboxylesterase family protein n=1 Tax=Streptomyces lutosisoli TaxID=2665721 RepID=A0ABW2W1B3_9ACTN